MHPILRSQVTVSTFTQNSFNSARACQFSLKRYIMIFSLKGFILPSLCLCCKWKSYIVRGTQQQLNRVLSHGSYEHNSEIAILFCAWCSVQLDCWHASVSTWCAFADALIVATAVCNTVLMQPAAAKSGLFLVDFSRLAVSTFV